MRILIVLLSSLFLVNCATMKDFDPKKKVEMEPKALGTLLKQDGQMLNRASLANALKHNPKTSETMKGYGAIALTAIIIAGVGGYQFGYGLGDGDNNKVTNGLLISALGIGIAHFADKKLNRAVEIHNESFEARNKSKSPLFVNFNFEF